VLAPVRTELFGDFLLLQALPTSGMAEVSVAIRLGDRSGRTFVVKRPRLGERPSGAAAQAIAREGEVLAAVHASGIVRLEAAGDMAGLPYVALEHVQGAPLDELIARAGPLSEGATAAIARDLARALSTLHAAGWVHGDVAPSNVLVDDAGDARLIDFGLATRSGERRDVIAGKPGYVAPEAVRPIQAHPAEDIYGWGVVVAECSLGGRLFAERDLAEAASRGEAPPAVARLSAHGPLVAAALRREAGARPSASNLATSLESAVLDRARLATLVHDIRRGAPIAVGEARAGAPGSRRSTLTSAPTPTAPMAVRSTMPDPIVLPRPSPDAKRRRVLMALLLVAALLTGALLGRLSVRIRQATMSFGSQMPRRAHLEFDGQPITPPADGSELPIAPGRHTLTLITSKGERREVTFRARPGEQVMLLPLMRNVTTPDEDHAP
jgi:serine/threonine-protein kinase